MWSAMHLVCFRSGFWNQGLGAFWIRVSDSGSGGSVKREFRKRGPDSINPGRRSNAASRFKYGDI